MRPGDQDETSISEVDLSNVTLRPRRFVLRGMEWFEAFSEFIRKKKRGQPNLLKTFYLPGNLGSRCGTRQWSL